jgi:hypothetical protein
MTKGPSSLLGTIIPLLIMFVLFIPLAIAWVRICTRVGWPGWLGVLVLVPFVNAILMLALGFSREWPIERRLKIAESGPPRSA